MTVALESLLNQDVRSITANITRVEHRHLCEGGKVRKLLRVTRRKDWLYLHWLPTNPKDCGYSGYRDDCGFTPTIEVITDESR